MGRKAFCFCDRQSQKQCAESRSISPDTTFPTSPNARSGFLVEQLRGRCAPTLRGQVFDDNVFFLPPDPDRYSVPNRNFFTRFGALPIVLHLTPINSLPGLATSFEKPRRPKPLVESNPLHCQWLVIWLVLEVEAMIFDNSARFFTGSRRCFLLRAAAGAFCYEQPQALCYGQPQALLQAVG